jgi:chemotaxis-related protein WspB
VLLVLFHLGNDCYALDASKIAEVLPLVSIRKTFGSPPGVVGIFKYRGAFVPVLDLSELMLGRSSVSRLSTRIIVVRCLAQDGQSRLLGLIAERATDTMRCDPAAFVSSGIVSGDAPYLGPIVMGRHGFVQRIEPEKLIPACMRDLQLEPQAAAQ